MSREVRCNEVIKNNGKLLTGITILDEKINISPTIYLDDLYEAYENGMTMEHVIHRVIQIYENSCFKEPIDLDFFLNYDRVRDQIVYKLISYERNEKLLEEVPHMQYLDLALVFYYIVAQDSGETGSILIRKEHLGMWNVSKEDIFCAAAKNTPRLLKPEIISMESMLMECFQEKKKNASEKECEEIEEMMENLMQQSEIQESQMYVLSNQNKMFGASCVLYRDVLREFAERIHHNLFVLPSSIHEVILLPTEQNDHPEMLAQMVKDINATQLEREEILSNHVYYYDRFLDEMELCN